MPALTKKRVLIACLAQEYILRMSYTQDGLDYAQEGLNINPATLTDARVVENGFGFGPLAATGMIEKSTVVQTDFGQYIWVARTYPVDKTSSITSMVISQPSGDRAAHLFDVHAFHDVGLGQDVELQVLGRFVSGLYSAMHS